MKGDAKYRMSCAQEDMLNAKQSSNRSQRLEKLMGLLMGRSREALWDSGSLEAVERATAKQ